MDYGNLKVPENVTPEVQAILDSYEARNKDIERNHKKEMAKLYGGAALQLGSAFIPGTLGLKAAGGAIKALTPYVGKKIAENVATGVTSGLASGAVEGLGRGLMEGENPLKTMVSDATLGTLFGGAFGLAGGKIGKTLAGKNLQKGNIAPQKYFDDYVAGLKGDPNTIVPGKVPIQNLYKPEEIKVIRAQRQFGNDFGGSETLPDIIADENGIPNYEANLKSFMKNSKVVDENGNPLVVYHGSNNDFDTFDKNKIGSNYQRDKKGFFFTSNKNEADVYGETAQYRQNDGQQKTYSTFLNIENPYTLKDLAKSFDYSDVNNFIDNKGELIQIYDDYVADIIFGAEKNGNDGIIFTDPRDGYTLAVAFEPTQIKSVNNQGTFDPTNPNIYKSLLPVVGGGLFELLKNNEAKTNL